MRYTHPITLGVLRTHVRLRSLDAKGARLGHSPCDILYVITDLQIGGVPLHLHHLARDMRQRGRIVRVVCLAKVGPVGRMLQDEGVPVESCQARGRFDLRVIYRLAKMIRTHRPKVVHALLFHANLASRLAARLAGFARRQLLCEIQTVEIERGWHLWADRLTHRLCRLTIGNSPSVIDHLHQRAHISCDRLRLVRGGIDPQPVKDAKPIDPADLGLGADDPIVLWVGRLDPIKAVDTLIRAMVVVHKQHRAHLLLAGEGPMRGELEQLVETLGLGGLVHFLGIRRDVWRLLHTADVFAFPSRTEGLPNALLEAMAAGCPVVTTDAPGCRDLIEHDRNGLSVPCDDETTLATALGRLLSDPTLARRLSTAAARDIDHRWHLRDTLAAYAQLYDETLA